MRESTGMGVRKAGLWVHPCLHSLCVPGPVTQLLCVTLSSPVTSQDFCTNEVSDVNTFGKRKHVTWLLASTTVVILFLGISHKVIVKTKKELSVPGCLSSVAMAKIQNPVQ